MTDIAPIHDIITEIRAGRMVVLVDEEDRANEGDLVFAAANIVRARSAAEMPVVTPVAA